jgi:hypothetical protein
MSPSLQKKSNHLCINLCKTVKTKRNTCKSILFFLREHAKAFLTYRESYKEDLSKIHGFRNIKSSGPSNNIHNMSSWVVCYSILRSLCWSSSLAHGVTELGRRGCRYVPVGRLAQEEFPVSCIMVKETIKFLFR